jgi:hypothetical protein
LPASWPARVTTETPFPWALISIAMAASSF